MVKIFIFAIGSMALVLFLMWLEIVMDADISTMFTYESPIMPYLLGFVGFVSCLFMRKYKTMVRTIGVSALFTGFVFILDIQTSGCRISSECLGGYTQYFALSMFVGVLLSAVCFVRYNNRRFSLRQASGAAIDSLF